MKYLVSFLLLFCGLSAFSQADTIFVLGAEFGAITEPTDSTFTVDIIHPTDQLGQAFTASKIQIGYRLIDVFGRLYRVKSVDASGIGSSTLTVVELQDAAGPSGTGLVYRKPDNSDCIPEIQTGDIGISYALAARIANHNAVNGCSNVEVTAAILTDSMAVVRDSIAAVRADIGTGGGIVETIVAGTGISVNSADPANPIVTNTAPDQTVSITGAGSVAITGTYPNFTATGSGLTGTLTENYIPVADATGNLENSTLTETSGIVYAPKVAQTGTANDRPSLSIASGFKTTGTGAIVINTGIKWASFVGRNISMEFGYQGIASSFSTQQAGTIRINALVYSGTGAYCHASVFGDPIKSETISIMEGPSGNVVFTHGTVTDAGWANGIAFWLEDLRLDSETFMNSVNLSYSTLTDLTGYTSRATVNNINKTKVIPFVLNRTGAANTPNNILALSGGGTVGGETGIVFLSFGGTLSDPTTRPNNSWGLVSKRIGGSSSDFLFYQSSTERFRMTAAGFFGIGTATPSYPLAIGGNAAIRLNPHDVTLTGAEGLLYADLSEKTFKGHNGTSFFRFMQQSATVPTNGQVGVFNSTTLLYEPSNPKARSYTPTSTADTNGATGDIAYDDSYIYIKTSAGWKRSALSTF